VSRRNSNVRRQLQAKELIHEQRGWQ